MATLIMKKAKEVTTNNGRTRNEHASRCKKHPKHKQSPGVCSVCLSQKLSQLSKTRTNVTTTSSSYKGGFGSYLCSSTSSLSSYYSSSGSSACSSPILCYKYSNKNINDDKNKKGSLSLLFHGKKVLTKSKSLAFVVPNSVRDNKSVNDEDIASCSEYDCDKKSGFWSKFLKPSRNKRIIEKVLAHSKTMRERIVTYD